MTDERATARVPVTPDTKALLDERKPDGVTFDRYVRVLLNVEQPIEAPRR